MANGSKSFKSIRLYLLLELWDEHTHIRALIIRIMKVSVQLHINTLLVSIG